VNAHEACMDRVKPFQEWTRYSGKNWSAAFKCPECGKIVWKSLNFLGRRKVYCVNGKTEARTA